MWINSVVLFHRITQLFLIIIGVAAQSAFYGGATGGIFSLLQSAGVVGFGIFGNTVIGLSGAGLGLGLSSMAGEGCKITHTVHVKYNGLYRSDKEPGDIKMITDFVKKQLKIQSDSENSRQYSEEIRKVLFAKKMEIELPGVIVYFETAEIQIQSRPQCE